jgi:hypothetical protein
MNHRKILKLEILGAVFISLFGSFLHFTFNLANRSWLVGAFSAVNESTWEHLKLAVIPAIIWAIAEKKIFKIKSDNFISAKTISIYLMPIIIVVGFYSYTAILGRNLLPIDIFLFIISVIIGQYVSYRLIIKPNFSKKRDRACLMSLIIILFAFIVFTFFPPRFFLFRDPITQTYGIARF